MTDPPARRREPVLSGQRTRAATRCEVKDTARRLDDGHMMVHDLLGQGRVRESDVAGATEDHLDEEMTVDLGDGIKMVDNVESLIIYGFGNEPHEAIRRAINWWLKDLEENGLIAWT